MMFKDRDTGVNYARVMAIRANSYKRHFTPSVSLVDVFEVQVQDFLSRNYAGETVFIKTLQAGKRPHSRLWEWNLAKMAHGVSAKTWLRDKLIKSFGYSGKQVRAFFNDITVITVRFNDSNNELQIVEQSK